MAEQAPDAGANTQKSFSVKEYAHNLGQMLRDGCEMLTGSSVCNRLPSTGRQPERSAATALVPVQYDRALATKYLQEEERLGHSGEDASFDPFADEVRSQTRRPEKVQL